MNHTTERNYYERVFVKQQEASLPIIHVPEPTPVVAGELLRYLGPGSEPSIETVTLVPRLTGRPDVPSRGTQQAAAYDVRAWLPIAGTMEVTPLQTVRVPTGLHFAIEPHSAMLICSRSGLASKGLMVANGPGILDSDYRGELQILLTYVAPADAKPFIIQHGDRVAQLLFVRPTALVHPVFEVVPELPHALSDRKGGFGSTGVQ